jgi:transcriptional regulator with XRE-family HTH domain
MTSLYSMWRVRLKMPGSQGTALDSPLGAGLFATLLRRRANGRGPLVAEVTPSGRAFGARLRALMEGLGDPETKRPITVDALYKIIDTEPELAMSRGHLYKLVEGSALPRLDLIEALARFFGVPASYFVDDHSYVDETIARVDAALAEVDAMILRLTELRVALVRERDNPAKPEKKARKPLKHASL